MFLPNGLMRKEKFGLSLSRTIWPSYNSLHQSSLKYGLHFWDKHKLKHNHKHGHTSNVCVHSVSHIVISRILVLTRMLVLMLVIISQVWIRLYWNALQLCIPLTDRAENLDQLTVISESFSTSTEVELLKLW